MYKIFLKHPNHTSDEIKTPNPATAEAAFRELLKKRGHFAAVLSLNNRILEDVRLDADEVDEVAPVRLFP